MCVYIYIYIQAYNNHNNTNDNNNNNKIMKCCKDRALFECGPPKRSEAAKVPPGEKARRSLSCDSYTWAVETRVLGTWGFQVTSKDRHDTITVDETWKSRQTAARRSKSPVPKTLLYPCILLLLLLSILLLSFLISCLCLPCHTRVYVPPGRGER